MMNDKVSQNFLQNLKMNWFNFTVLLLDCSKGMNVLQVKSAVQIKLSFYLVMPHKCTVNGERETQVAV
jgi:hypothetical protein